MQPNMAGVNPAPLQYEMVQNPGPGISNQNVAQPEMIQNINQGAPIPIGVPIKFLDEQG